SGQLLVEFTLRGGGCFAAEHVRWGYWLAVVGRVLVVVPRYIRGAQGCACESTLSVRPKNHVLTLPNRGFLRQLGVVRDGELCSGLEREGVVFFERVEGLFAHEQHGNSTALATKLCSEADTPDVVERWTAPLTILTG